RGVCRARRDASDAVRRGRPAAVRASPLCCRDRLCGARQVAADSDGRAQAARGRHAGSLYSALPPAVPPNPGPPARFSRRGTLLPWLSVAPVARGADRRGRGPGRIGGARGRCVLKPPAAARAATLLYRLSGWSIPLAAVCRAAGRDVFYARAEGLARKPWMRGALADAGIRFFEFSDYDRVDPRHGMDLKADFAVRALDAIPDVVVAELVTLFRQA